MGHSTVESFGTLPGDAIKTLVYCPSPVHLEMATSFLFVIWMCSNESTESGLLIAASIGLGYKFPSSCE